jgi:hypothetical protein
MKKLIELIKYILEVYPKPEELSKPRLVKLIYLIDWKHAINTKKQYTDIRWIFNHYGPYVNDVINVMKQNPKEFIVSSRENPYGGVTDKFKLNKNSEITIEIDSEVKNITDFLISKTTHLSWSKFISVVYSTYPVKSNLKYSRLDLENLAKEYKIVKTTANTV